MKKPQQNLGFDWKSKIVDLLIVIIGISIAYNLNTWNESIKRDQEANNYIENFYGENENNKIKLTGALEFSSSQIEEITNLQNLLFAKEFDDERIKDLTIQMLGSVSFDPSTTTMENIIASGEFKYIKDRELRKEIISTYNSYRTTAKLEGLLSNYVFDYLSPYLYENIRFSNLNSIGSNFFEDPQFENLVISYLIFLKQKVRNYQNTLDRIIKLDASLAAVRNDVSHQ